jgi:hypothetical protein
MYNASADLGRLCTNLMATMKELMIFRSVKDPEKLLERNESDLAALKTLSERFPQERILYSLRVLQETAARLPFSLDKRADTEVCPLRLARPDLQPDTEALQARIATLEQTLKELKEKGITVRQTPQAPAPAQKPVTPPTEEPKPVSPPPPKPKAPPVFDDPFANPSVSSAGKYTEPADTPRPTPPAAPKPTQARPAESTNQSFVEGWQPLDAWRDIAHTVSRTDRLLGFILEECPAVYQGRTILVLVENRDDYTDVKSAECMNLINQALVENRKEGYTVKIENCAPDKYIPHATFNQLQKENLFDFGDEDEEIPEYDE